MTDEKPVELSAKVRVKLPFVPCSLYLIEEDQPSGSQVKGEERSLPVSAFSDEALKMLGERWTKALLNQARDRDHREAP
jgi:hypothetical protein